MLARDLGPGIPSKGELGFKTLFALLADIAGLLDAMPIFGSDLRAIEKAFVQWDDVYVRAISD